jgi:pimeloyl-ACP methyl ester carboxylesterase
MRALFQRAMTRAVALVALVLIASACSSVPQAITSTTTSTTTTTLPHAVIVEGSFPQGPVSAFGPIWRVPVQPFAPGTVAPSGPPLLPNQEVDEARIGYRQFGNSGAPSLLLIAGEHASMTWWDPQLLNDLAGRYLVTLVDLPGVGYSSSVSAPSVSSDADLLAGFLYALGLAQPTVLGWGLGGDVALALAERHASMIGRLVLADCSPGGSSATRPAPSVSLAFASRFSTMEQLSDQMFPPSADAARVTWLSHIAQFSPDDVVGSAVATQALLQEQVYGSSVLSDRLDKVLVPTLIVQGALDALVPADNARLLYAGIARARLKVFADAGYGAIFQDEPQFVTALENFLSATPLPTGPS